MTERSRPVPPGWGPDFGGESNRRMARVKDRCPSLDAYDNQKPHEELDYLPAYEDVEVEDMANNEHGEDHRVQQPQQQEATIRKLLLKTAELVLEQRKELDEVKHKLVELQLVVEQSAVTLNQLLPPQYEQAVRQQRSLNDKDVKNYLVQLETTAAVESEAKLLHLKGCASENGDACNCGLIDYEQSDNGNGDGGNH